MHAELSGERSESPAPAGRRPHVVVFTSLFPSVAQPNAGLFIRERMFRVRDEFALTVVSPVPWFPLQSLIRRFRPGFRPETARFEVMDGVRVYHPRFISLPGFGKWLDGISMAICTSPLIYRIRRCLGLDLIDAHFAYPDGYAASQLGRWFRVPVTITLRGTEARLVGASRFRRLVRSALENASQIIAVSSSLKKVAVDLGVRDEKIRVIGNGVDLEKFSRMPKSSCRQRLGIAEDAKVLISVGGLTERKGFHRVIECLPGIISEYPKLVYLIVGGSSVEGDWGERLKSQVASLRLENHVRFLGALRPDELKWPLSAADAFVLATSNEGWANVFLEAMACGLPIVTTDVGGNAEVVSSTELGTIVPFGDANQLLNAVRSALLHPWNQAAIIEYARQNTWEHRIDLLKKELRTAMSGEADTHASREGDQAGKDRVHSLRQRR